MVKVLHAPPRQYIRKTPLFFLLFLTNRGNNSGMGDYALAVTTSAVYKHAAPLPTEERLWKPTTHRAT